MRKKVLIVFLVLAIVLAACGPAKKYQLTCSSGNKVVYDGVVTLVSFADEWVKFTEFETGKKITISNAACVRKGMGQR